MAIDAENRETRKFLGMVYKTYFDTKELDQKANKIELELGEVGDDGASFRYKILQELQSEGVFLNLEVQNEQISKIDEYSQEEDGQDFISVTDEYFSVATGVVDEQRLKSLFKEYSFYPKYFLRRYKTREIVINDEFLLAKPDFMSPVSEFFDFLYNRPYKAHSYDKVLAFLKEETGEDINRKPSNFLQQLNFVGEIKNLFFSQSSKKAIYFWPVIMNADYRKFVIDENELQKQLADLPTI